MSEGLVVHNRLNGTSVENTGLPITKLPKPIEEFRYENPQGTIEYLLGRKELYKTEAQKEHALVKTTKEKLRNSKRRTNIWKNRFRKESNMKNIWQAIGLSVGILVCLIIVVFVLLMATLLITHMMGDSKSPNLPINSKIQQTPTSVLSSVNILNGNTQGSGTVISVGEAYATVLSVAHLFTTDNRGPIWIYYPDGTYTTGTLLAVDRGRDLSLVRVDADTVLEHSYVPEKMDRGTLTVVGYPKSQGPDLKHISYTGSSKLSWYFTTKDGLIDKGNSGSGIFINNACVGVANAVCNKSKNVFLACPHNEIVAFLNEAKSDLEGCGDWRQPAILAINNENQPPLWTPKPNVPLNISGRTERALQSLAQQIEDLRQSTTLVKPKRLSDDPEPLLKRPSEVN